MAEEGSGADASATDTVPKEPTPKPDDVPEPKPDQPPKPDLPKEYEGKTMEDLVKEHQELQKKLGEQGKELGDTKSNLAYQQQLLEMERRRGEQARIQPETPEQPKPVDWDYTNPIPSVEEVVERRIAAREKQWQDQAAQQIQSEAGANYASGRRIAMQQNAKLFEGIEAKVEQAMSEAYQRRYIDHRQLGDPQQWVGAARLVHLADNNLDRLQSAEVKPVGSTETELPTPAKPGTAEKPFTGLDYTDREVQKMMDQYGLTREEAEEIIKEEQEATARGER